MTTIRDLFVNYENDQTIERIECSSIRSVNSSTKEINVYNPNVRQPLQKYLYILDNVKLDKKLSGGKQAKVVLSSQDKKLIESIKNLNQKIDEYINYLNENGHNITDISDLLTISEYYPPVLTITLDQSAVLDTDGTHVKIMSIANGSMIKMIVELERLIIRRDTVEKIWRAIQIKKVQNLTTDSSIDLFDAYDGKSSTSSIQTMRPIINEQSPPPPSPPIHSGINRPERTTAFVNPNPLTKPRGFSPPSAIDLRQMITNLKSARTAEQTDKITPTKIEHDESVKLNESLDNAKSDESSDIKDSQDAKKSEESEESKNSEESEDSDDSIDPFRGINRQSDTDEAEESDSESLDPFCKVKQVVKMNKTGKIIKHRVKRTASKK